MRLKRRRSALWQCRYVVLVLQDIRVYDCGNFVIKVVPSWP